MKYKNPYLYDRDTIEHGWATKAEERAYNREYYQKHKEELLRKAREAREGIQRTAQNAYNTARSNVENAFDNVRDYGEKLAKDYRTSANITNRGLTDRIIDESRSYLNRNGVNILKKDPEVVKRLREEGRTDKEIDDFYKYLRNSTIARGAARNERAKAARQNSPVERVKRDLRRTTAGARSNVENAFNNAGRAIEDIYNNAQNVAKRYRTSKEQRQKANSYKFDEWVAKQGKKLANYEPKDPVERERFAKEMRDKFGPDVYERTRREAATRVRQAGAAANEAAKASMTRAQKEALKKREEAKRRMQKWFKR